MTRQRQLNRLLQLSSHPAALQHQHLSSLWLSSSKMTFTTSAMSSDNKMITWPKFTLYGDPNMRPFRNIWMLEEIGVNYNHVNCKPWSSKAKAVHPLGKVPALVVEPRFVNNDQQQPFVVLESGAINTFLGDLAREIESNEHSKDVMVPPPATLLRAKYDSLILFIVTEIDFQALWVHRKHSDLKDVFGDAPTAVAEAKRQFHNALGAIELELNNESGYLLPSGFSPADILLATCCFWAQQIGWLARSLDEATTTDADKESQKKQLTSKLMAYLARCRHRPAFIKANVLRKAQENHLSKL